jgi:hypothetical protein
MKNPIVLKRVVWGIILLGSGMNTRLVLAEELDKIFEKVSEYVSVKNYPQALEELSWARKEIEKKHLEKLKDFFPAKLLGFEGEKFSAHSAFGMSEVERRYVGPGVMIKVSLMGSSKPRHGVGGLPQFGEVAAMMGMHNTSQDTLRIQGFTATLEEKVTNRVALSIFLDGGSIFKLEMTKKADADLLKKVAEELNLQGLDAYIRGQE